MELTRKVQMLMFALLLMCGGLGAASAFLLRQAIHQQEDAALLLRSHMTADMMHDAVRGDVLEIIAARDPALKLDAAKARDSLKERLATLRASIEKSRTYRHSREVTAALDAVAAPLADYQRAALAISDRSATDPAAAGAALPQFFTRFEQLEGGMEKVTEAIEAHTAAQSRWASGLGLAAVLCVLAAMACALLVAARVAAAMRTRLIQPLTGLADTILRMAEGERGTAVAGTDRSDELGALARGMEAFRAQLAAAEEAKAAQSALIVASIGEGLSALARGDLGRTVDNVLDPPFAALRTDFNQALHSLAEIVGEVRDSATVLRLGAREISGASGEIARRIESNAAALEETSAALSEIDGEVKRTAAAAIETESVAKGGLAIVSKGRETADGAVAAMGRVSDSAQGIDAVIEGLDKIAFQTRVLAMNAAVEAGRAGEAGRGFAVVADLVSALAMRAEEEAKLARDQLTTTRAEIGEAVEAVRSVDQALDAIAGNVETVNGRISGIAEANDRQAGLISQIRDAIESMNQTTQHNAAMVEESAAAAAKLTSEAERLAQSSGRFVLPGAVPEGRLAA
ncbi:HAMP domain-containing methyl-accepting chemotaxis protein [Sphingomonas rosea]|uniref:HAMP domain-containing methyl-accepting chemotaxis protein n=1 Tax=Sphingomonas rosea TaxID=335605 RepID=A0ABP7U1Z5_9SPHN